ncbi:MAG: uroporphyrinogen decarboxylase [Candidatus Dormibacteria bacterium]
MSPSAARMLAASRQEPTDSTPVWFMRQAGRSLPQYRLLRQRMTLLEMVRDPAVCCQVTCMPVELLGVDAAVLFADIMLPLEGMGVPFQMEDGVGPVVTDPIRTEDQIDALRVVAAEEATPYLFEGIRLARRELGGRAALIGFGPSPFTLACYLVEGRGSRDFPHVRALMYAQPSLWSRLMRTLTEVLSRYLVAQVDSGAQLVQVFDSWAGVLDEQSYRELVAPHLSKLFGDLRTAAPAIYFSTGSPHLLGAIAEIGAPGISVDWRLPLREAWSRVGPDFFLQGNLDPALVLSRWEDLERGARAVLKGAGGQPGHIFNLGHGVLPDSDPSQLRRLVEFVHEFSGEYRAPARDRGPV